MKKELVIALAAFFYMALSAITGVYAVEDGNKIITVSKDKVDVSGDGKKDTVIITGIPYVEDGDYLKEIYMEISASNGKTYRVELDGGLRPKIDFVDLNHDGVADMYIGVDTGGSGGITKYYLYSLKDFNLTNLTVPDPLVMNSQFLNGYKARITIQDTGKSYMFDLRDRADEYERSGLYQNGRLSEPTELMVDAYSTLKPVLVKGEQYGLIGSQAISGAIHADTIAIVESTWFYENGKWVLMGMKIKETNPRKTKGTK
ncbi:hypothetical protein BGM26_05990 [Bacillus sp. FJAT-29790]|uniref:hypothetical protein n=1 Tax=Bacillus sp. FJAT-29790 TaxID=1895002 RepID=UPI001C2226BC|nr:hypothetical protein [Bacillus sp. FJAT-29790]MBU8878539.1 hypothetical protein [Bacillus sp. FJAT-29790]